MAWLTENLGTIVVSLILAAIILLILRKMIRDRRQGKHLCSCGGDCECCASRGLCESPKKATKGPDCTK